MTFESNEESESIEEGKKRFENIKQHIEKLRQIVDEQCDAENYRWIKNVEKCFDET
ncbi:966_t:CDS:1, partial [Paraglomus occultum]